jgi:hypothetical protein
MFDLCVFVAVTIRGFYIELVDERLQFRAKATRRDDLFSACNWNRKKSAIEIAHAQSEIDAALAGNLERGNLEPGVEEILRRRLNRLSSLHKSRRIDSSTWEKHRKAHGHAIGDSFREKMNKKRPRDEST